MAGVDGNHPGVAAAIVRKAPGPTENLGPVICQPLDVLWVARMGERMVEHRIGKAALMMRGRQRQKRRFTAREFEERRTSHRCTLTQ